MNARTGVCCGGRAVAGWFFLAVGAEPLAQPAHLSAQTVSAGVPPHEAQAHRPDPSPRGRELVLETPGIPDSLLTALVLSGGGSRGLAHAGALQGLER